MKCPCTCWNPINFVIPSPSYAFYSIMPLVSNWIELHISCHGCRVSMFPVGFHLWQTAPRFLCIETTWSTCASVGIAASFFTVYTNLAVTTFSVSWRKNIQWNCDLILSHECYNKYEQINLSVIRLVCECCVETVKWWTQYDIYYTSNT
jgi:hypothetical protein